MVQLPKYRELVTWMRARQEVYRRKTAGEPRPWTKDPYLNLYHFCNVFRDQDRTTRWLVDRVLKPADQVQYQHLWFLSCFARFFNLPTSIEAGLRATGMWPLTDGLSEDNDGTFDPQAVIRCLGLAERVFSTAYMVRSEAGVDKVTYVTRSVLLPLWENRLIWAATFKADAQSMRIGTELLSNEYGFGGFMAYEVTSDLAYTSVYRHAPDRATYAHLGPGAVRGLKHLTGRDDLEGRDRYSAFRECLRRLTEDHPLNRPIESRDLEHSLCEFDKYERLRNGGTYRRRYRWQERRT